MHTFLATPRSFLRTENYLSCKGRNDRSLRRTHIRFRPLTVFRHSGSQPFLDQPEHAAISHAMLDELHRPFVAHIVKEPANVRIQHPVHSLPEDAHIQRIQRLMRAATGTEPIREAFEIDLIYLVEDRHHGLLNKFVLQGRNA